MTIATASDLYWWFSFECSLGGRCDVMTDVRVACASDAEPPAVRCPKCGELMSFRGRWEADEWGYGSRGDTVEVDGPRVMIHLYAAEVYDGSVVAVIPGTEYKRVHHGESLSNTIRKAVSSTVDDVVIEAVAGGTRDEIFGISPEEVGRAINFRFLVLRKQAP